jgi:hypothetical protein
VLRIVLHITRCSVWDVIIVIDMKAPQYVWRSYVKLFQLRKVVHESSQQDCHSKHVGS